MFRHQWRFVNEQRCVLIFTSTNTVTRTISTCLEFILLRFKLIRLHDNLYFLSDIKPSVTSSHQWHQAIIDIKPSMTSSHQWHQAISDIKPSVTWSHQWHQAISDIKPSVTSSHQWHQAISDMKPSVTWSHQWHEAISDMKPSVTFFNAFFCPGSHNNPRTVTLIQIYIVDWTDVYDTQHWTQWQNQLAIKVSTWHLILPQR